MHKENGRPQSQSEIEKKFYEQEFRIAAHGFVNSLKLMTTNAPSPSGKSPYEIRSTIASQEINGVLQEIVLSGGGHLGVTEGSERRPLLVCPLEASPYENILFSFAYLKYPEYIDLPEWDDAAEELSPQEQSEKVINAISHFVENNRSKLTYKFISNLRNSVDDIRGQYRAS